MVELCRLICPWLCDFFFITLGSKSKMYMSTDAPTITEVNLSAFIYTLFHEEFSPIVRTNSDVFPRLQRNLHEIVCKQMQIY